MVKDYLNAIALKKTDTWLFVIGGTLVLNHISLIWRIDGGQLLANTMLLWMAVCLIIWQKRDTLNFQSKPAATSLGLFILSFTLLRSAAITEANFFTRIYPLFSLIGWGLLASGFRGLKQYLKELLILSCLILDSTFLSNTLNISQITATFSGYLLWYLGFPVRLEGVNIILPEGSVQVNSGCSGYTIMLQLLGLSLIFISIFPTSKKQKFLLPLLGIVMGFAINIVRVGLMALLVAANQKEAFKYWHEEDGSLVFSAIGVVAFSLLYHFLNRHQESEIIEVEE